ncbi:hypothetical protein IQ225_16300, partial [Synechocystis salina LEGE 06155]|nr:hypothetical protein [Synechocystis salina LEGE 06155]
WTESTASSYRDLVIDASPFIYLRLGEREGTVARNIGKFQGAVNGTYNGTFSLNQPGALENTATNSG